MPHLHIQSARRSTATIAPLCLLVSFLIASLPGPATAQQPFITASDVVRPRLGIIENPALSDEATAVWVNPAGLGFRNSSSGFFSHSFRTDDSYTNLLLSGGNVGFGWQRSDIVSGVRLDRWRFALGGLVTSGFSIGAAVQYANPNASYLVGNYWAWDFGFEARPTEFLSIGGVARNVGAPSSLTKTFEAGLGFRPIGDRFTLFGGPIWDDSDDYDNPSHWHVGAIANMGPGIELSGAINQDGTVAAGLSFVFGHGSVGTHSVKDGGSYGPVWGVASFTEDFRRSMLVPKNKVARLTLSGDIRDYGSFSLFGGSTRPLSNLITQIDRAAKAPDVAALYVKIENISVGQGMADELRAAFVKFKDSGKPLVCYAIAPGVREYYIATAADSIFVEPTSYVLVNGYSASPPLLRGMLDKIGLKPQFARIGEYKSASEIFTDSTLSEPYREQLSELIDARYERLVAVMSETRGMTRDSVMTLIDQGLFTAADAVRYGLIDAERSEKDGLESVQAMIDAENGPTLSLADRRLYDERWGTRPKVAVVFAYGDMILGNGGVDFLSGAALMGSERLAKALKTVREDRSIRAVVLRVDSGGGLALAAEQIWREAKLLADSDKPFIVSVGDVAASGAYYMAVPADTIVSNPGAVVGSIGILGGKISAGELLDKIGVNVERVQRGENASIMALGEEFSEDQLALLQNFMQQGYDIFIGHVAEGRDMTVAEVDSLGRGRIYTAERGVELGLVDEIGGLTDAIQIAMQKAGIENEAELVPYPEQPSFFERVMAVEGGSASLRYGAGGVWYYDPVAEFVR